MWTTTASPAKHRVAEKRGRSVDAGRHDSSDRRRHLVKRAHRIELSAGWASLI
jgi:hypothetical protein